jgi:hypothetical protein
LAHPTQQTCLLVELNNQCSTASKGLAAGVLLHRLWSRATTHQIRNETLLALLECFQTGKEASWCYAVLHLAFYPSIYKLAVRFPQFSWSEIHSAFSKACENYPLQQTEKVSGYLKGGTLCFLFKEDQECSALEKLGEVVAELMGQYSLSEILTGEAAPDLDRVIARRVLNLWVRGGLMKEAHLEHVLERYFPTRSSHSAAERQRQTRAVAQFKEAFSRVSQKVNRRA